MFKFYSISLILLLSQTYSVTQMHAQSPGGVSNSLSIWLKADAGTSTTLNGDQVASWVSQAAGAITAQQVTASNRPTYNQNVLNGYPSISTSSTKFMSVNLNSISNTNSTVIIVNKRESSANFLYYLGITSTSLVANPLICGYASPTQLRYTHYNDAINLNVAAYAGSSEEPAIIGHQFSTTSGKNLWRVYGGQQNSVSNATTNNQDISSGTGRIGRGNSGAGFAGQVYELIVYNRILSSAELSQIHTYLNVKYGISIPLSRHQYFTDAAFANDLFGIGKNSATQGLNQNASVSVASEDILEIRDALSLDDGDYIFCGNNDGNVTFSNYPGTNCLIKSTMERDWKIVKQGVPGKFTLKFDLTGLSGFNPNLLKLIVDLDNDGYDDEIPFDGVLASNVLTFEELNLPNNATFTLAEYADTYYAVASGLATAALWSYEPAGTPFAVASFCPASNISVQNFSITSDIPNLSCRNFSISAGGVWNDANALNVSGNVTIAGTYNGLTNNIITFNGTDAQTISGSGLMNVYNLTSTNIMGVTIASNAGGVFARNIVAINSGSLTTNGKLTLASSALSTGMIAPLIGGASVIGNVTLNRRYNVSYIPGGSAASQMIYGVTSPFTSSTLNDWIDDVDLTGFPGSTYPTSTYVSPRYYNEVPGGSSAIGWTNPTSINNPTVPGRGWQIKMTSTIANAGFFNLDVTGNIVQGNFSIPVTYTNNGVPSADGFNLIGNPYPCAIDWNAAGWTKTNVANTVYVYNGNTGQYSTYINGVSGNGGSNIIPSSQGFYVITNGTSPVLSITESCKSTSQGVFRSEADAKALRLSLESDIYSDEVVFVLNPNASSTFNFNEDALKMRTVSEDAPTIASIANMGEELAIYSSNRVENTTIIPLVVKAAHPGLHHFTHRGLNTYANGACIVLEDLMTGDKFALNEHDRIPVYLYENDEYNRFQLIIGGTFAAHVTPAGCTDGSLGAISLNENASATLTDINGQEMQYDEIQWTQLPAGYYFLSIPENSVCGTTNTEIFVAQHPELEARFNVKNVDCPNDQNGQIEIQLFGASEPISYLWSNGMTSPVLENLKAGEYSINITDAHGCAISEKTVIEINSDLAVDFVVPNLTTNHMSQFHAQTTDFANCIWNFGDGNGDITGKTITKTFQKPGEYIVTCMVSNGDCSNSQTKSVQVRNHNFHENVEAYLNDQGLVLSLGFIEPTQLIINAYAITGQLISTHTGTFESQNFIWETREKLAGSVVEVINTATKESKTFHLGY